MIYTHLCKDMFIEKIDRLIDFNMSNTHFHDHYEIYYMLKGSRQYFIRDKGYKVGKGDIVLIPKGELHMTRLLDSPTHSRYLINFTTDYFKEYIPKIAQEDLLKLFDKRIFSMPSDMQEHFENLLDRLLTESENKDKYSKDMLSKYLFELLVFIKRELYVDEIEIINDKIEDDKILDATTYILKNYQKNISLDDISNYCYLSKYHFSRKFKEVTGFTFIQYLTFIRIKESIKLLVDTNKSITEISFSCGFKDSNYFGDLFKKYVGVPPLKYRKNIRN